MSKFTIFLLIFLFITFIYTEISEYPIENFISTSSNLESTVVFTSQEIPNDIYENMIGKSIPLNCKDIVKIDSLSYLQISYWGFDNTLYVGEMIVNANIATDVLDIFKELYEIKYPIEKIKLIDEYNANDELSMSDNNTSCFCYRTISNSNSLSNHAKRYCNRYKSFI